MKNDGMDEMNIREYLENHKLLTDGAMGTYFDTVEKENYICSEEANITNPSLVRQIQPFLKLELSDKLPILHRRPLCGLLWHESVH